MVLRGVLELSFANYVCIRGFVSLNDLAKYSKIDETYQRRPIDEHVRGIINFIKQGEYHYYPEILLGMACDRFKCVEKTRKTVDKSFASGFEHYTEVKSQEVSLYDALKNMVWPRHETKPEKCRFYNRHFGELTVTVGERKNYFDKYERERSARNEDVPQLLLNVAVAGFERIEGGCPLYCIDGNHRLEAVRRDTSIANSLVPFCLMLFENEDTCREHGAMLFHNINYHQWPVSDERNAQTITERKKANGFLLFSDGRLLSSQAFGQGEYYFVRKTWEAMVGESGFVAASSFDSNLFKEIFFSKGDGEGARTFLLDVYRALFAQIEKEKGRNRDGCIKCDSVIGDEILELFETRPKREEAETSIPKKYARQVQAFINKFVEVLHRVDGMLSGRNDLKSEHQNAAIAAALVVLSFYKDNRCPAYFLDYAATHHWGRVKDLSVSEVLALFEEQLTRKRRTIFVSMPFYKYACEYHYQVIKEVVAEINDKCKKQLGDVLIDCHKVDRNDTGKTFEINQKVADSIAECGLLIADLTYSSVNVFHEVGMLMGRAFALQGHTNEFDMILLCDESESSVNDVEYNLHSLQMVCFKHPDDLKRQLLDRLLNFYKLKLDVEE